MNLKSCLLPAIAKGPSRARDKAKMRARLAHNPVASPEEVEVEVEVETVHAGQERNFATARSDAVRPVRLARPELSGCP